MWTDIILLLVVGSLATPVQVPPEPSTTLSLPGDRDIPLNNVLSNAEEISADVDRVDVSHDSTIVHPPLPSEVPLPEAPRPDSLVDFLSNRAITSYDGILDTATRTGQRVRSGIENGKMKVVNTVETGKAIVSTGYQIYRNPSGYLRDFFNFGLEEVDWEESLYGRSKYDHGQDTESEEATFYPQDDEKLENEEPLSSGVPFMDMQERNQVQLETDNSFDIESLPTERVDYAPPPALTTVTMDSEESIPQLDQRDPFSSQNPDQSQANTSDSDPVYVIRDHVDSQETPGIIPGTESNISSNSQKTSNDLPKHLRPEKNSRGMKSQDNVDTDTDIGTEEEPQGKQGINSWFTKVEDIPMPLDSATIPSSFTLDTSKRSQSKEYYSVNPNVFIPHRKHASERKRRSSFSEWSKPLGSTRLRRHSAGELRRPKKPKYPIVFSQASASNNEESDSQERGQTLSAPSSPEEFTSSLNSQIVVNNPESPLRQPAELTEDQEFPLEVEDLDSFLGIIGEQLNRHPYIDHVTRPEESETNADIDPVTTSVVIPLSPGRFTEEDTMPNTTEEIPLNEDRVLETSLDDSSISGEADYSTDESNGLHGQNVEIIDIQDSDDPMGTLNPDDSDITQNTTPPATESDDFEKDDNNSTNSEIMAATLSSKPSTSEMSTSLDMPYYEAQTFLNGPEFGAGREHPAEPLNMEPLVLIQEPEPSSGDVDAFTATLPVPLASNSDHLQRDVLPEDILHSSVDGNESNPSFPEYSDVLGTTGPESLKSSNSDIDIEEPINTYPKDNLPEHTTLNALSDEAGQVEGLPISPDKSPLEQVLDYGSEASVEEAILPASKVSNLERPTDITESTILSSEDGIPGPHVTTSLETNLPVDNVVEPLDSPLISKFTFPSPGTSNNDIDIEEPINTSPNDNLPERTLKSSTVSDEVEQAEEPPVLFDGIQLDQDLDHSETSIEEATLPTSEISNLERSMDIIESTSMNHEEIPGPHVSPPEATMPVDNVELLDSPSINEFTSTLPRNSVQDIDLEEPNDTPTSVSPFEPSPALNAKSDEDGLAEELPPLVDDIQLDETTLPTSEVSNLERSTDMLDSAMLSREDDEISVPLVTPDATLHIDNVIEPLDSPTNEFTSTSPRNSVQDIDFEEPNDTLPNDSPSELPPKSNTVSDEAEQAEESPVVFDESQLDEALDRGLGTPVEEATLPTSKLDNLASTTDMMESILSHEDGIPSPHGTSPETTMPVDNVEPLDSPPTSELTFASPRDPNSNVDFEEPRVVSPIVNPIEPTSILSTKSDEAGQAEALPVSLDEFQSDQVLDHDLETSVEKAVLPSSEVNNPERPTYLMESTLLSREDDEFSIPHVTPDTTFPIDNVNEPLDSPPINEDTFASPRNSNSDIDFEEPNDTLPDVSSFELSSSSNSVIDEVEQAEELPSLDDSQLDQDLDDSETSVERATLSTSEVSLESSTDMMESILSHEELPGPLVTPPGATLPVDNVEPLDSPLTNKDTFASLRNPVQDFEEPRDVPTVVNPLEPTSTLSTESDEAGQAEVLPVSPDGIQLEQVLEHDSEASMEEATLSTSKVSNLERPTDMTESSILSSEEGIPNPLVTLPDATLPIDNVVEPLDSPPMNEDTFASSSTSNSDIDIGEPNDTFSDVSSSELSPLSDTLSDKFEQAEELPSSLDDSQLDQDLDDSETSVDKATLPTSEVSLERSTDVMESILSHEELPSPLVTPSDATVPIDNGFEPPFGSSTNEITFSSPKSSNQDIDLEESKDTPTKVSPFELSPKSNNVSDEAGQAEESPVLFDESQLDQGLDHSETSIEEATLPTSEVNNLERPMDIVESISMNHEEIPAPHVTTSLETTLPIDNVEPLDSPLISEFTFPSPRTSNNDIDIEEPRNTSPNDNLPERTLKSSTVSDEVEQAEESPVLFDGIQLDQDLDHTLGDTDGLEEAKDILPNVNLSGHSPTLITISEEAGQVEEPPVLFDEIQQDQVLEHDSEMSVEKAVLPTSEVSNLERSMDIVESTSMNHEEIPGPHVIPPEATMPIDNVIDPVNSPPTSEFTFTNSNGDIDDIEELGNIPANDNPPEPASILNTLSDEAEQAEVLPSSLDGIQLDQDLDHSETSVERATLSTSEVSNLERSTDIVESISMNHEEIPGPHVTAPPEATMPVDNGEPLDSPSTSEFTFTSPRTSNNDIDIEEPKEIPPNDNPAELSPKSNNVSDEAGQIEDSPLLVDEILLNQDLDHTLDDVDALEEPNDMLPNDKLPEHTTLNTVSDEAEQPVEPPASLDEVQLDRVLEHDSEMSVERATLSTSEVSNLERSTDIVESISMDHEEIPAPHVPSPPDAIMPVDNVEPLDSPSTNEDTFASSRPSNSDIDFEEPRVVPPIDNPIEPTSTLNTESDEAGQVEESPLDTQLDEALDRSETSVEEATLPTSEVNNLERSMDIVDSTSMNHEEIPGPHVTPPEATMPVDNGEPLDSPSTSEFTFASSRPSNSDIDIEEPKGTLPNISFSEGSPVSNTDSNEAEQEEGLPASVDGLQLEQVLEHDSEASVEEATLPTTEVNNLASPTDMMESTLNHEEIPSPLITTPQETTLPTDNEPLDSPSTAVPLSSTTSNMNDADTHDKMNSTSTSVNDFDRFEVPPSSLGEVQLDSGLQTPSETLVEASSSTLSAVDSHLKDDTEAGKSLNTEREDPAVDIPQFTAPLPETTLSITDNLDSNDTDLLSSTTEQELNASGHSADPQPGDKSSVTSSSIATAKPDSVEYRTEALHVDNGSLHLPTYTASTTASSTSVHHQVTDMAIPLQDKQQNLHKTSVPQVTTAYDIPRSFSTSSVLKSSISKGVWTQPPNRETRTRSNNGKAIATSLPVSSLTSTQPSQTTAFIELNTSSSSSSLSMSASSSVSVEIKSLPVDNKRFTSRKTTLPNSFQQTANLTHTTTLHTSAQTTSSVELLSTVPSTAGSKEFVAPSHRVVHEMDIDPRTLSNDSIGDHKATGNLKTERTNRFHSIRHEHTSQPKQTSKASITLQTKKIGVDSSAVISGPSKTEIKLRLGKSAMLSKAAKSGHFSHAVGSKHGESLDSTKSRLFRTQLNAASHHGKELRNEVDSKSIITNLLSTQNTHHSSVNNLPRNKDGSQTNELNGIESRTSTSPDHKSVIFDSSAAKIAPKSIFCLAILFGFLL